MCDMDFKMWWTIKVFFSILLFGLANSLNMDLTGDWKAEVGWEVKCIWEFPEGDRLQSVRLYNGVPQFLVFRPERHGERKREDFKNVQGNEIQVDCEDRYQHTNYKNNSGECVIRITPLQPPIEDVVLTCEVSGERPHFYVRKMDYIVKPFVAPSDAAIAVAIQKEETHQRLVLNCSSSGLPAPSLAWTVDDQKVPSDFTGRAWNTTTKLWHSWSTFSTTHDNSISIKCTPEVVYKEAVTRGQPLVYDTVFNSAKTFGRSTMVIGVFSLIFLFLR